ncbi:MAG TPA: MFS transporter, partial [Chitinophagaceae bacterium]|nr:MFS transporter [Chitinophagaceae bacterium]
PTATSAYASDAVHPSRRAEALGAVAMGYTIGQSVGPIIGSYLVNHYSYNVMFYASSAFAMGSVIILYNIRETLPNPQRFKRKHLYVKRNEIFEASALKPAIILLLLSFASGCTLTIAPDLSDDVGLHNKGMFFGVYTATALLIRLLAGKTADRYGRIPVLVVSSVAMAISMLVLAYTTTEFMLLLGAAIFGLSWGMNGPTITAWTVDLAAPEKRGRAVASMYIALEAGIGIGAIICADIYNNNPANFIYAFALPGVLAMASFFLLLLWRKQPRAKGIAVMDVAGEEV